MFLLDTTFEDTRILARSQDGHLYDTTVMDSQTGAFRNVQLTAEQLSMVLQFNLDNNGAPAGCDEFYKELEPIFAGWPQNLRPIP
jgi:hypothetical protein